MALLVVGPDVRLLYGNPAVNRQPGFSQGNSKLSDGATLTEEDAAE